MYCRVWYRWETGRGAGTRTLGGLPQWDIPHCPNRLVQDKSKTRDRIWDRIRCPSHPTWCTPAQSSRQEPHLAKDSPRRGAVGQYATSTTPPSAKPTETWTWRAGRRGPLNILMPTASYVLSKFSTSTKSTLNIIRPAEGVKM